MCGYSVYSSFGGVVFFIKPKTAYEMRISDWSSDVCSSDLHGDEAERGHPCHQAQEPAGLVQPAAPVQERPRRRDEQHGEADRDHDAERPEYDRHIGPVRRWKRLQSRDLAIQRVGQDQASELGNSDGEMVRLRSEEHTSELQSLMRISYAVFCLQQKQ